MIENIPKLIEQNELDSTSVLDSTCQKLQFQKFLSKNLSFKNYSFILI